MSPQHFLFIFLALLVSAAVANGAGKGIPGGWTDIKNINDPHVIEIAEFAVAEHNKQSNSMLKLEKVLSGKTQVVAGTNFKLLINTTSTSGTGTPPWRKYMAVVYERSWEGFRNLTSFVPIYE